MSKTRKPNKKVKTSRCGGKKERRSEDGIYTSCPGDQLGLAHGDTRGSIYDSKVIFFEGSWGE